MPLPALLALSLARLLTPLCIFSSVAAFTFQSVPSPDLDLSQLGRVALVGDFDTLSLYEFVGQNNNGRLSNGSQSLLGRYPNGDFATVLTADAYIEAICPFVSSDGTLNGVIVAGNFTGLDNQPLQGVALLDPTTNQVTPLTGLTGQVSSLYCDPERSTVFFGGSFSAGNSTNAVAWVTNWTNLPFAGFNGPVTSIAKLPNGNIVFGGSFTGFGNTSVPTTPDAQVINLVSANITAQPSTTTQNGFGDPRNILCKTANQTGPGSEWLLADNAVGFWQANFGFGFEPTKLRLYNSQVPGYGTKTWRFTALPLNGIMNFTFTNAAGVLDSCTAECPLPENNSTYQDFYFVNQIGMNSFRIDISAFYGTGAGLSGIELFENDIYSFAVNDYNEPKCDDVSTAGSNSTSSGPWTIDTNPSGMTSSEYLTAYLNNGTLNGTDLQVVFQPDIRQSGNYSITVYTPGCYADNSCISRGIVNVSVDASATGSSPSPVQLYQTNNYDKYDQVFYGYVDANGESFRPSVTITPSPDQVGPLTVVAQRVRFELVSSTGGLNGLFEYNPNLVMVDNDFSDSIINTAGTRLSAGAEIKAIAVSDNITFVAGSFQSDTSSNILAISPDNSTTIQSGGLNNVVQTLYQINSTLYVGGNFTGTLTNGTSGLNNVAIYDIGQNSWQALGAGVNGYVWNIVPLNVNVTDGVSASAIAVSGWFTQVLGFDNYQAFAADNTAIWVPSQNNWLYNLNNDALTLSGRLTAQTDVPGMDPIYAGSVESQAGGTRGVVGLDSANSGLTLQSFPVDILPQQSTSSGTVSLRDVSQPQVEGVATGLFYKQDSLNLTVLGGRFSASATNGSTIQNLAIINGSSSNNVTGISSNLVGGGAVLALDYQDNTLFIGGSTNNTLIFYDLQRAALSSPQPPALQGNTPVVYAIASQPSSSAVYVGGSFSSAGSFDCPALCYYDTASLRWNSPNGNIADDSVVHSMTWSSNSRLIVAGDLSFGSNSTFIAEYNSDSQTFTPFPNTNQIPGPINTFSAVDDSYQSYFVAGRYASNNTSYLAFFDGDDTWTIIPGLDSESIIQGVQILSLGKNHAKTPLLGSSSSLLVTGQLSITNFGSAGAALYDGNSFTPFALSTLTNGSAGSIHGAFVQNPQNLLHSHHRSYLAVGFIVLIALAIALAIIFLIVVIGIVAERVRRRREGYVRAPTATSPDMYEKHGAGNVGDIPAEKLFSGVNR